MTYKNGEIIFDKYRIERLIGEGTFGEVYLVTHIKLDLPRVIKLIHHDAAMKNDPNYKEIRRQFQQEAQIGARIDHPALIRVYDFDESDDLMSIAMEYAAGGSLLSLIFEKNLSSGSSIVPGLEIPRIVEISRQVAGGLAAIHAMDIVHRDLKPSNILFNENGQAKIADLGLAQIKDAKSQSSQSDSQLMRSTHPGTPAYMSPEQESSRLYLTTASDIYSFGLILFEMLTGRLYKNLKPGTRATDLRPDTPAWLGTLLDRCLSEDPAKRPWNGDELAKYFQENDPESEKPSVQTVPAPVAESASTAAVLPTTAIAEPVSRPVPSPVTPPVIEMVPSPAAPAGGFDPAKEELPTPALVPARMPEAVQIIKNTTGGLTEKISRTDFTGFFQKFRLQMLISGLVIGIILVILFFATNSSRAATPTTTTAAAAPKAIAGTLVPTKPVVYAYPTLDAAGRAKLDKQIFGKWSVTRVVGFPAKGRPFQDAGNTMEFLSNGIVKILTYDNFSNSYAYSMDGNRLTFTFKDGHKDVWILAYYEFKDGMQLSMDGTDEIMDLSRIQ